MVLVTSRLELMALFRVTKTPLPVASLLAARMMALYKFIGPSGLRAEAGRITPTITTGLTLLTTGVKIVELTDKVEIIAIGDSINTIRCFQKAPKHEITAVTIIIAHFGHIKKYEKRKPKG